MRIYQIFEEHCRTFLMAPVHRLAIHSFCWVHEPTTLKLWNNDAIKAMTKRTMTHIMDQTWKHNISYLLFCHFKLRLVFLKDFHLLFSKITDANTMLKTLVCCWRIHLVATPKLLKMLKSFEMRSIDNAPTRKRIIVDWSTYHISSISITPWIGSLRQRIFELTTGLCE